MEEQGRALQRIKEQLLNRWRDLYIESDPEGLILKLYGTHELFAEPLALAAQLAAPTPITVELVDSVLCSRSRPFRSVRKLDEPVAIPPKPVEEDARGVALFCDCAERHTHDWGGYKPLKR